MAIVCAWCGQVLEAGSEPVSHGICGRCALKLELSFARRFAPARPPVRVARRGPSPRAGTFLPGFAQEPGERTAATRR